MIGHAILMVGSTHLLFILRWVVRRVVVGSRLSQAIAQTSHLVINTASCS